MRSRDKPPRAKPRPVTAEGLPAPPDPGTSPAAVLLWVVGCLFGLAGLISCGASDTVIEQNTGAVLLVGGTLSAAAGTAINQLRKIRVAIERDRTTI